VQACDFNFLVTGVEINQMNSWNENGEILYRLEMIYPEMAFINLEIN
jgi:hypothetical protein